MGASVGRLPPGFKPRNDRNLSRWHAVKGVPGYREVARGRFPLGVALSAQCGRNVERAPREGGQRRSLQSCARDRYQHAPKPGVFRVTLPQGSGPTCGGAFFDLRAWRALLTSCLAHHRVGLAEPCSRWDSLARSEPLGVVTGDERSRQSSSGEFVQEPHDRGVRIRGGAPGAKGIKLRVSERYDWPGTKQGGWSTVRKQWRI